MNRIWRWFQPGLGLKRWLLLFAAGIALLGLSVSVVLEQGRLFARLEGALTRWATARGPVPSGLVAGLLALAGVGLAAASVYGLVRSVLETLNPGERGMAEKFYRRRQLFRGPRVVAIGGGTGLPAVLRGLKEYTANLTAIVTVADDGGSSGRLRSEFGILPPGDIRNCLVALADTEPLMERLFQHRFEQGEGLSGHSFGNLFILAMTEATGDFYEAVRASSQVLAVRGRVIPSTLDDVRLHAELADGRVVAGESAIARAGGAVRRVFLDPPDAAPVADALQAIAEADAIVLGPGSLYTSILPNLLVPGIAEAIRRSPAVKIYVCNVMTQPGETDAYTAADHVRAILAHAGQGLIDWVVVNTAPVPAHVEQRYATQGARPVPVDVAEIERLGVQVVRADVADTDADLVRHHPGRLATVIARLMLVHPSRADRPPWDQLWLRQRLREQERLLARRAGEAAPAPTRSGAPAGGGPQPEAAPGAARRDRP
ncbi:gluconeogenesis factor YvcK family protein [Caldinitratiruptor microaerophilus]|uniref:Putative gluconeogenesis factor n=1 Tax=Caldinitratiruptor microaerophilus TaxID=671077 RepID=A0AA35G9N6_9FIRM|nr:YvcK family protein [Caldinitratiruptor microaerophilus]BDG61668.1 putative gluconeogenesis factor [Caldinitratiruptor microaerophilus]